MPNRSHTPGPWLIGHARDGDDQGKEVFVPGISIGQLVIVDNVGGRIHKDADGFYTDHEERNANARLIAAAPALAAALGPYNTQPLPMILELTAARLEHYGDAPNNPYVLALRAIRDRVQDALDRLEDDHEQR